ncbi:hypothetical protein F5Y16DRAFT_405750 [Xylariaceae sp. FL0255]|nr:hypothetical protein F5Y16DRAFT_405750 [Xylariaceae sp. FL0255]
MPFSVVVPPATEWDPTTWIKYPVIVKLDGPIPDDIKDLRMRVIVHYGNKDQSFYEEVATQYPFRFYEQRNDRGEVVDLVYLAAFEGTRTPYHIQEGMTAMLEIQLGSIWDSHFTPRFPLDPGLQDAQGLNLPPLERNIHCTNFSHGERTYQFKDTAVLTSRHFQVLPAGSGNQDEPSHRRQRQWLAMWNASRHQEDGNQ